MQPKIVKRINVNFFDRLIITRSIWLGPCNSALDSETDPQNIQVDKAFVIEFVIYNIKCIKLCIFKLIFVILFRMLAESQ